MSNIGPLKFNPILKPVLWGGSRIASFKGAKPFDKPIGETWEISGLEGFESIVLSNDSLNGLTIRELLDQYGYQIMGQRLTEIYGNHFPLLIKFIDAAQDLSIQVHPNDAIAYNRHKCSGKTELWYIIDSKNDATIYSGFKTQTNREELKKHINNGTLTDLLAHFTPHRGDTFYLPAGRIHSIGAGNLLLEIQQTSDITYRVFDYNRTDLNGKKRELHTDLAIEAIDYQVYNEYCHHYDSQYNNEIEINRCEYFVTTLFKTNNNYRINIADKDSFRIIIITAGNGILSDSNNNTINLNQGDVILIPATTKWVDIKTPNGDDIEIVTTYVP